MSIVSIVTHLADSGPEHIALAGHWAHHATMNGLASLQDTAHPYVTFVADNTPSSSQVDDYRAKLAALPKETQVGWLAAAGTYFIGIFQKGGEVFTGFVSGIIPTLVVLMTAFYALTALVGEERVHGLARGAGKIALTRYTILPVLSVFFLTNPMAYTFGSFLEEKHKPAFYDAAVSYVHPPLGLFPHVNPGEYFVWGGVLVALLELEKNGKVAHGYHIQVALWYAIVGLVVILLKGIVTERITAILARRQGVEL